jgi:hypothetical protein
VNTTNKPDAKSLNLAPFSDKLLANCHINDTPPPIKYRNILSTVSTIYTESGFFKGFYKGVSARIMCVAPSMAISWGSYEFMKTTLTNVYK